MMKTYGNDTDLFGDGNRQQTDFRTVLFEYLLHWPIILLCLLAALAGAYLYLRYQAPVYNISSSVLIKQGEKNQSPTAQFASVQNLGTFSMANNFDNEVEILRSYTLIRKTVNELNLYISYSGDNRFGYDTPLYSGLPVRIWMSPEEAERLPSPMKVQIDCSVKDAVSATVSYTENDEEYIFRKSFFKLPAIFITPAGTITFSSDCDSIPDTSEWPYPLMEATIVSPSAAAGSYKRRFSAEPASDYTSIVQLSLNDESIRKGTDFLNTLVRIYNNDANEDKNQVAMRTAEFIDERIQVINDELGTTEEELAEYKQRAGLTDLNTDAQMALQENSEYEQKRADNENQQHLVRYLRDYIENPENENEVIPANVGLTDAALTNIITQYNQMMVERKRLLRTSKETSPAVINLDATISATRSTVLATLESVEEGLQITRKNLDIEAGKFRTRISNTPKQERELRDISRQQEIKANLYLMLLQKREDNAITLAAIANNGRIVEEPRGIGMVAPDSRNIYMIAVILGLLVPVGGIWLSRSLRFRIESREDLKKLTVIPVVGDIPQMKDAKKNGIMVQENRNDVIEEVFRTLRTNLQYMLRENQKVILFTSTTSNEGKSFTAANLAASFAFMEKKTVIVGLDIRNPSLGRIFGLKDTEHGITEFLASPSSTDLLSLCRQSGISPNLYILPCGIIPPNPTELVARPALDEAVRILKEKFDYVILDTAPIGLVTDTRLIARDADLCVYLCKAGYTRKNEFLLVNDLEKDERLPHFCILLNGIDMNKRKNGYYYGYGRYAKYGKYGYGRRYGYSYGYGKKS